MQRFGEAEAALHFEAESAYQDIDALRQMPEQLRLEAEPLAAMPRSCPEAQPLAQMPTLAPGFLCHSADLTDSPRTYPVAW